ncbi:hypothetical protein H6F51_13870 [Cyanobacteria bacterium FACHB-DQ100]|nr:hypothetical protein [Cyanobacteria bacterium FACHB-DQ100]
MPVECSRIDQNRVIADLDRFAWDAICDWSKHTQARTHYNGIDYAELSRCFLWDKVARAIRKQTHPKRFEFEQALLDRRPIPNLPTPNPNQFKFWLKRSLTALQTWQDARSLSSKRILYVPHAHPTLQTIVRTLARTLPVVAPENAFDQIPELQTIRLPLCGDSPRLAQVNELHRGILEGLQAFAIALLPEDIVVLRAQLAQLFLRTEQIDRELSLLRPAAILVFADNHFPVQSYVLAARKQGIKSIMLQHGLDCEHYCLDEAYADIISVWGKSRLQRYQTQSSWQPEQIQVNGNPEYDSFSLPHQIDLAGCYWLWATRPHCPEKCYSPSRHPQEGIQILEALLTALARLPQARLVIKPHPLDQIDLYQSYLDEHCLADRVAISTESVRSLLPEATVVISEDSTIGLEAMFFGKIVIHAHFAASEPVLPLVQYGAALPGYSPQMLQTALQTLEQLSDTQLLAAGQRRFIQEFADYTGQAQERVTAMIRGVLDQ